MIGVNLILHVASAIAAVLLIMAVLRLKGQRDTLRHLLALAAHRRRTGVVMEPGRFLQKICNACGLTFIAAGTLLAPRKITLAPWRELFSSQPVSLVLWDSASVVIVVAVDQLADVEPIEKALAASLGEAVQVKFQRESDYDAAQ